jgi:formylglycine-generating enzyme required for sulfatase activity
MGTTETGRPGVSQAGGGWSDTEIKQAGDDRFGFQDYAEVLARRAMQAGTPLTIGVYGRWGSGKTSLMGLMEAKLKQSGAPVETLWINVWQLSNQEQLWNAFLQALLTRVRDRLSWRRRLSFDWGLFKERVKWRALFQALLSNSYRILITITPLLLANFTPAYAGADTNQLLALALDPLTGGGASLILALWLLVRPAVEAAREKVSLDLKTLLKDAPYEAQISTLQQLEKQFARMVKAWVGEQGRLVIFIDDLDRCTPDKVPEVLEAIKLFTTTTGCVYVIGLDHDIIRRGIQARYKFDQESDAAEYLEKIVQIPFFLPPLDEGRIEAFLRDYYADLKQLCPTAPDVFAAGLEPNPRRVKRAINIYRTLLDLVDVRVKAWEMDPVDPELVAKMVVIESRFRDLHHYLVKEPAYLLKIEEQANTDGGLKALPEVEEGMSGTKSLVDEAGLEALGDTLREGEKRFGDREQRHQISSYIYLITTAEGAGGQVRPNRREREVLLSNDPAQVKAQVEEILQRGGKDEATRQQIGQVYVERLEKVLDDPGRYTAVEQASARFALSLLELALLGQTAESIHARLEALLPPFPEPEPAQKAVKGMIQSQAGGLVQAAPQAARQRLAERLWLVLAGFGLYDTAQILTANMALDLVEGWECQEFEPQTLRVPAGPFVMGSTPEQVRRLIAEGMDESSANAEQPQHTVELPAYRIGRYPVTNAEYRQFVEAGGYTEKWHGCWTAAGWAQKEQVQWTEPRYWRDETLNQPTQPVVGVSWYEAVAYCYWLAKVTGKPYRLPTEAEWEKAARGPDGRIYPWGNEFDSGKCNTQEADIGHPTPVGQYSPAGDSPHGAADLAGNVWEWCATEWGKAYPYNLQEDEWSEAYLQGEEARALRGGAWFSLRRHARASARRHSLPDHFISYIGLRVVVAPVLT